MRSLAMRMGVVASLSVAVACGSDSSGKAIAPDGGGGGTSGGTGGHAGAATGGTGGATGGRAGSGGNRGSGGNSGNGGKGGGAAPDDAGPDAASDGGTLPPVDGSSDAGNCLVTFADDVFESRVRAALGQKADAGSDPVTCADMRRLVTLDVSNTLGKTGPPTSISGIEAATNLIQFIANYTTIADIGPLGALPKLFSVSFRAGKVANVSPLRNHPRLQFLDVGGYAQIYRSPFSDLSLLGDPPKLTTLWIGASSVKNFSALATLADTLISLDVGDLTPAPTPAFIAAGVPKLQMLQMYNSGITDASPFQAMTDLQYLRLNGNFLKSLLPLVNNTGLGSGDALDVQTNCLDFSTAATVASTQLATLTGRGVSVMSGFQRTTGCP